MQKKITIHIEMSHISYSLELVLCANIVTWFLRKQNWTYNTTHSVQLHLLEELLFRLKSRVDLIL